ncbi:hypothetical protein A33M_3555 [Rhodovulum sp. PH10]|nr:hypothetical protein A33M_3555 [Rhodovulum sp. PH10]
MHRPVHAISPAAVTARPAPRRHAGTLRLPRRAGVAEPFVRMHAMPIATGSCIPFSGNTPKWKLNGPSVRTIT